MTDALGMLGAVGLIVGPTTLIVAVIVALSNRQIREERIEHLEGTVSDLRGEMEDERRRCDDKVRDLEHRCSHLEGQVDAAVGDLGDRVGRAIAEAVITRLAEDPL